MDGAIGIDSTAVIVLTSVVGAVAIFACSRLSSASKADKFVSQAVGSSSKGKQRGPNEISHVDFEDKPFHRSIEELFKTADKNDDGTVTKRELKRACQADPEFMKELGLHRVFGSKEFFNKADADKSANLNLNEFKEYLEKVEAGADHDAERRAKLILTKADEDIIESTFKEMDSDNDNGINQSELADCFMRIADKRGRKMKPDVAKQHAKKAMRRYNKGAEGGNLDLADFQLMVLRCPFVDIFGDHQPAGSGK
jgi:Ca2+-binding EF-hand superfamily protein